MSCMACTLRYRLQFSRVDLGSECYTQRASPPTCTLSSPSPFCLHLLREVYRTPLIGFCGHKFAPCARELWAGKGPQSLQMQIMKIGSYRYTILPKVPPVDGPLLGIAAAPVHHGKSASPGRGRYAGMICKHAVAIGHTGGVWRPARLAHCGIIDAVTAIPEAAGGVIEQEPRSLRASPNCMSSEARS